MNTTTNLGLKKPQKAAGDPIDIDVLNDNSDIIDSFAGETNTALASKQKELTAAQQAAVDSGITEEKLTADEAALVEVIDGGAAGTKNLLDCSLRSIKAVTQNPSYGFSWNGNVCTSTIGASFTINTDNSITVAATNTQNDVWFKLTDFMYSAGSYVISGCPTNGSTSSYYIESDALNYRDIGNGVSFTINSTTTDSIYIVVKSGQTFEKTFYPMLCSKVLYDADLSYVPYAPALTNIILTPALIEQVDNGAKNLSSVSSGIISNSGGGFPIPSTPITVPIGTYIVSFKFSGNATRGSVQFRSGSTTSDSLAFDMAPLVSVRIEITSDTIDNFNLYSNSTATISEFMICTAHDWAISQKFVPYCPTMAEMYAMILELQNGTRSALALAKAEPEEINEPETGEAGEEGKEER